MSGHQEEGQQQSRSSDILDGSINCEEQDDDEQSIIDVFEFDDTAHDRWLCSIGTGSRRNSAEARVQDLDAWLHADVSEAENVSSENCLRRNIDSRTFTRIKRRSNAKLNFDQVEASVSPETMSNSLSNLWRNETISESALEEQSVLKERRDSVPMMLRPKTNQVLAALLSESPTSITSQTSIEAFANMARSKEEMNSLLNNLNESDTNHFLMNVSQPSLLYSSIISDGKGDDSIQTLNDSLIDSQILTESMMEASMFKEVQDTTIIAEFLKQSNDFTSLEDKSDYKSLNSTVVNDEVIEDEYLHDKTYTSLNLKTNETFVNLPSSMNENEMDSMKVAASPENLLKFSPVHNNNTCNLLNSTKVISSDSNIPVSIKEDILSTTCLLDKENEEDLTHILTSTAVSNEKQLNATFQKSNFSAAKTPNVVVSTKSISPEHDMPVLIKKEDISLTLNEKQLDVTFQKSNFYAAKTPKMSISTKSISPEHNMPVLIKKEDISSILNEKQLDVTFQKSNFPEFKTPKMSVSTKSISPEHDMPVLIKKEDISSILNEKQLDVTFQKSNFPIFKTPKISVSTKSISPEHDMPILIKKEEISSSRLLDKENEEDLIHTFKSTSTLNEKELDVTLHKSNFPKAKIPKMGVSTKSISPEHDNLSVLIKKEDMSSTASLFDKEYAEDVTHTLTSTSVLNEKQLNATFQKSNFLVVKTPSIGGLAENCRSTLDATFNAVPTLRAELLQEVQRSTVNSFDSIMDNAQLSDIETKLDITYDCLNEPLDEVEVFDATYVQKPSLQKIESQNVKKNLGVTSDSVQTNTKLSNPTSVRQISYTKKNQGESQIHLSDPNRFNTFRKDSKIGSRLSKASQEINSNKITAPAPLQPVAPSAKNNNDNMYQQRFNTFSKRMSTVKNKIDMENNVNESTQDNKFIKLPDKLPRKIQPPRQLSKLPQLFQKSNPNLGTNLKSIEKLTMIKPEVEFIKGSQPNIARNVYSLSRFKSERVLEVINNTEFPVGDSTSRSMESIESTASVHSAPDIDDRLSICSENSGASYTIKPKNFDTLNKFTEERERRFSILKPKTKKHHVLENTWIEDKNLPSPILKNSVRNYAESVGDSRSTSPSDSAEFNAKTSSPLTISPASSDQAISKAESDDGGTEVTKENIQDTVNIKPKQIKAPSSVPTMINATKLRRPSNWTGGPNKVANIAVSGIPRPASRIPAPKFARPNLK